MWLKFGWGEYWINCECVHHFTSPHTHTHTEGDDYEVSGANVDIRVSRRNTRPCFSVGIVNDNIYKTGRRFYYTLGSHDHHVIIRGTRGVVQIADNDEQAVTIGFESSRYYVMESESVEVCLWMTAGGVGQPMSVIAFTGQTASINPGETASSSIETGAPRL